MFGLVSLVVSALLVAGGGFYGVCKVVKIWTGLSDEEAANIVRDFVNGTPSSNSTLEVEIMVDTQNNIHNVLGDKRYREHCELANSDIGKPLISTDSSSGLSVLEVCVFPADENEQRRIATIVINVVKKHLGQHGCDTRVVADWRKRDDLDMPCLEVGYAKNRKQQLVLVNELASRRKKIVARNTAVTDDTEEVDLFE